MGKRATPAKKERAMNATRHRLENQRSMENAKREAAEKKKLREEKEAKETKLEIENGSLRVQLQKLHDITDRLEKENRELNNMMKVKDYHIQKAKNDIKVLDELLDSYRSQLRDQSATIDALRAQDNKLEKLELKVEEQEDEINEQYEKIIELVKKSVTGGSKLKSFGEVVKKDTINARCGLLVKCMHQLAGEDKETMNSFVFHLVQYLSKNQDFEFSLQLSVWESYYATVRWNLSNMFHRDFQRFCSSKLSFTVFQSLHEIRKIKKLNSVKDDYHIAVRSTIKKTRSGKEVTVSTVVVKAKDVKKMIKRRLEDLYKHNRLKMDEDVILGFGGDKGSDTTKLVIVLENTDTPNDPHGVLLIGYYTGNDNYENLKSNFLTLFQQMNQLKTITYKEGDTEVTRNVKILLIGDCKFISSTYNHAGQSSLTPCFRCDAEWSNHGANKARIGDFPFEVSGSLLTLNQMIAEGKEPLILTDPSHAAPPGIHTFIGLQQNLFLNYFIALTIRLDYEGDTLPVDLTRQKELLKNLSSEESYYLRQLKAIKVTLELVSIAESGYTSTSNQNSSRNSLDRPCSSSYCIVNCSSNATVKYIDSFKCKCKKEFHLLCELFVDADDAHKSKSRLKCLQCQHGSPVDITERKDILVQKRLHSESLHDNFTEVYLEIEEEKFTLESLLNKSTGAIRKRLEALLVSIGCDYRIWYQEMNGNQTRIILRSENIEKIISLFKTIMEERGLETDHLEEIGEAMKDLGILMSHADNSIKSDEEIDDIENIVKQFVSRIRYLLPDVGVQPKLHLLTAHLVPHLRQHHIWGRVSEQGIESLHGLMNKLETRFSSIRNVELHAILILEQLGHYNKIYDVGCSWANA